MSGLDLHQSLIRRRDDDDVPVAVGPPPRNGIDAKLHQQLWWQQRAIQAVLAPLGELVDGPQRYGKLRLPHQAEG